MYLYKQEEQEEREEEKEEDKVGEQRVWGEGRGEEHKKKEMGGKEDKRGSAK